MKAVSQASGTFHHRHFVRLYSSDQHFVDASSQLIAAHLDHDDIVIAIASAEHLEAMDVRLQVLLPRFFESSFHAAIYVPVDARKLLQEFMRDGRPDEFEFAKSVGGIAKRAIKMRRGKVVILDEMGALLAASREIEAAERIESLWNELLGHYDMTLYCAYFESLLQSDSIHPVLDRICCAHHEVL